MQIRSAKLVSQIEATFKQMETAGMELECFQALQKQEELAASIRINNLFNEVNQQKELERTMQQRYGSLVAEKERIEGILEWHNAEMARQQELAMQTQVHESPVSAEATNNQTVEPDGASSESLVADENLESSVSNADAENNMLVDNVVDAENNMLVDNGNQPAPTVGEAVVGV